MAWQAVAALMTNRGDIYDYLEVVGKALPIQHAPVPSIAVPTTSGTGSEVRSPAKTLITPHPAPHPHLTPHASRPC